MASSYLKFDTSVIKDLGKADDGQAPNPGPVPENPKTPGDNGGGLKPGNPPQPEKNPKNDFKAQDPSNKPGGTKSPTTTKKQASTSRKLPQTSDPVSVATLATALISGLGATGAGLVARLRNKNNQ